jgi:hypothetical protein
LLLSATVALCCSAFSADVPRAAEPDNSAKISIKVAAVTSSSEVTDAEVRTDQPELPDSPVAKISDSTNSDAAADASPISSGAAPFSNSPVRPAGRTSLETPRERNTWYALLAISHSAAVFDAYSTRRAISGHYGVEGNPLLRPFSHSNAIYAATQVSPAVMDYLGHRMLKSQNPLLRRFWWLPQTGGAGFSIGAGVHNYRLVQ